MEKLVFVLYVEFNVRRVVVISCQVTQFWRQRIVPIM